ncbi:MAG: hypothetical protein GX625_19725 [Clostridiaceae bacterium]|nr:hypothetical protein [Clostridiaceae bacterium]
MSTFVVSIQVDVSLTEAQVAEASDRIQPELADRVATDTNAYVPMRTGLLRSDVSVDGNKIRYNALNSSGKPYSKFVYYGKKYKHSSGGRKWGEAAKSAHLRQWVDFVQKKYEEELR